jgi:HK97 family phage prohead protease
MVTRNQKEKKLKAQGFERRTSLAPVRLEKRAADNEGATFSGYAAKYNSRTWIGPVGSPWGFWEQIKPGAFDRALKEGLDVVCVFNHDVNQLLGRVSNKTLTLSSDDIGLSDTCIFPDTTLGHDVATLVERGDIPGQSFAFNVTAELWETLDDGTELRTLVEVYPLMDVSPCTMPAYTDTTAAMREAYAVRSKSGHLIRDAGSNEDDETPEEDDTPDTVYDLNPDGTTKVTEVEPVPAVSGIDNQDPDPEDENDAQVQANEERDYLSDYWARLHRMHLDLIDF